MDIDEKKQPVEEEEAAEEGGEYWNYTGTCRARSVSARRPSTPWSRGWRGRRKTKGLAPKATTATRQSRF